MVNLKQYYVHKKSTYKYELTADEYNPEIDSEVVISVRVTDYADDPVSNMSVELFKDGTSVSASITNNVGVASWNVTLADWDNHHFTVANQCLDLKATGWRTVQNLTNYTIYCNGEFVQIDFHHNSNATLPKDYDYSLPTGYYPKHNVSAISGNMDSNGVHYAVFNANTAGSLKMRLHKATYTESGGYTIYGTLVYPY